MSLENHYSTTLLLPVWLDDSALNASREWPGSLKRTRNIGNFSVLIPPRFSALVVEARNVFVEGHVSRKLET